MKKYGFFILLLFFTSARAQHSSAHQGEDSIKKVTGPALTDSIVSGTGSKADSQLQSVDSSSTITPINPDNANRMLELQKEIRRGEKKKAITRIAVGIALLGVLVIGLIRKSKK